jgi:hypothetical protein
MVQAGKSMPDWRAAWAAVRERMRRELGDPVFDAWIGPLNLESFESDDLKIGAAKPFVRNWVANHYVGRIEKAFMAEGFTPASLAIVISAMSSSNSGPVIGGAIPREAQHQGLSDASASVSYLPPRSESRANEDDRGLWNRMLHPQQTFESFIPGMANQFGHGAARAFADGQQSDIPLLYIHGGFGFGKTHLLNAAALEFRKRGKRTLVPACRRFHAPLPGRALSQGHAGLQGRAAHRRSADHRRSAAHLPLDRHGVGIPLHGQRLCRPAPPGGDRRRPSAAGAGRPGRRRQIPPGRRVCAWDWTSRTATRAWRS